MESSIDKRLKNLQAELRAQKFAEDYRKYVTEPAAMGAEATLGRKAANKLRVLGYKIYRAQIKGKTYTP